jgi:thiosulfate reductase cytochrome b subunit
MKKRVMFPGWLRLWHWTNAALFFALVATGVSLHFAGMGSAGLAFRWSVIIHNIVGVALVVALLYYFVAMVVTGHFRQFLPYRGQLRDILLQTRFYLLGIFRGAHHPFVATPERRFNPIQQLAYVASVFVMLPAQGLTGVFLLFPDHAPDRIGGMGGIWPMAVTHSVLAYALGSFLVVHLYLALTVGEPHTGVGAMALGDRMPPPEAQPRAQH